MFTGGEGDRHYLLRKALPIYAQEDPYMIKFLNQQKYIDIVTQVVGWIDGVCISYPTYLQTQGCYLVKVKTWTWTSEHEQVNKTDFFLEYFVNIEKILKEYSLTHDIEYIMMWRIILSCVYGWMIIMDEKDGWTK
jgi:hypothetical protein